MTSTWEVRQGHVVDLLRAMPARSIHCIATSPPYYGLRDYGLPPQVWGGDPACAHRWEEGRYRLEDHADRGETGGLEGSRRSQGATRLGTITCGTCGTCGAWRGSLGLEPTPELYVEHLVGVLVEAFRVLRDDGTLWLNLGDTYSGGGRGASQKPGEGVNESAKALGGKSRWRAGGLPPKSLIGIPWRVALALQARGLTLRADVIWAKGNPMPESVNDRPSRAHEYLFLVTKGERYFYDAEAIRETRTGEKNADGRRNKRSVWAVNTSPFPEAHFATFPPDLVRPCILAGTSERGCCSSCGAPVEREVARAFVPQPDVRDPAKLAKGSRKGLDASDGRADLPRGTTTTTTTGWRRTCDCDAGTEPCRVMDPFNGAATAGIVALQEGRSYIGLELNGDYVRMSERRLSVVAPLLARRAEASHG